MNGRAGAAEARRLPAIQRAITEHMAADLTPDDLCARVLATLGEALGWTFGADAFAEVSRRLAAGGKRCSASSATAPSAISTWPAP